MNKTYKYLLQGLVLLGLFIIWTCVVKTVDLSYETMTNEPIGLSHLNLYIHKLCGVNMNLYLITDYLGLVPILVCLLFGFIGLAQLIKHRSIFKVDHGILLLGIYYLTIIIIYLLFEIYPVNYRPILIDGRLEASYPSSTTLLVLTVMSTLLYGLNKYIDNQRLMNLIKVFTIIFMIFMVIGRLMSGVHWFSDIIGSILLSIGLLNVYLFINNVISINK